MQLLDRLIAANPRDLMSHELRAAILSLDVAAEHVADARAFEKLGDSVRFAKGVYLRLSKHGAAVEAELENIERVRAPRSPGADVGGRGAGGAPAQ